MHSETSRLWNLKRLSNVFEKYLMTWKTVHVNGDWVIGFWWFLFSSAQLFVVFKFSTMSKNYLYSGEKNHTIIEQKERKNVECNLWSNNDLVSIFFPKTDGRPSFIWLEGHHHSPWRAALKLTLVKFSSSSWTQAVSSRGTPKGILYIL